MSVQEQYSSIWEQADSDKERGEHLRDKLAEYLREHDGTPLQLYNSPDGVVDSKMVRGWCGILF